MGTVYLARHARLRREVALKLLPTDRLKDSAAVARFDREMQAVGQLNHPNIVVAHDAGEVDGTHYLAMELVEGWDVGELARELGPLPVSDACEIGRQAALGLQHAHERGMVHCDIKPSNLMLTRGGQVKILDMGLALLGEKHLTDGELTGSGQLMGTLDYMAPEQGSSSHRVDIRADIYSLGATLYKLLCGQAPFGGAAYDTPVRKLMALATENPQPVEQRRPDVPAELAALVDRMLSRNPEHRPSSPAEVATALAPFAASSDLMQLLVGTTGAAPSPENTATDPYLSASATDTTSSRDSRRMDIPVRPTNEKDIPVPPLTPAAKTSPTKPALSPRRHRRTPILIATAAGLLALIALAIVMTLQTPQGTVTVEIAEQYRDQVTVVVKGGGQEIELSGRDGWQAKLAEGRYTVDLKGSSDQFELSDQTLTIRRGKDQVVCVNHAPRAPIDAAPTGQGMPDAPPSMAAAPHAAPAGPIAPPRVPDQPESMTVPSKVVLKLINTIGPFTNLDPIQFALSPDGRHIAVGTESWPLRILDTQTGQILQEIRGAEAITNVRFSPDGKPLAVSRCAWPYDIIVYRTVDWEEEWRYREIAGASAFSPDGTRLAMTGNDAPHPRVFDVATGEKLYECRNEGECFGRDVVFSPDGKRLMSTYRGENPHLWDAETGKLIRKVVVGTDVKAMTISKAGFFSNEEVNFNWGDNRQGIIITLRNNASRRWPGEFMALSADRRVAATRSLVNLLIFRSPASGEVLAETQELIHWGGRSCFSADGTVFAALDTESQVKIWELEFTSADTEGPNPSDGTVTDGTAASAEAPE